MQFALTTLLAATAVLAAPSKTTGDVPSLVRREASTHTVVVSGEKFLPRRTKADVGDSVLFVFLEGKHAVQESSYESPCAYLEGGFSSGTLDIKNSAEGESFYVDIIDTNPIWFYNGVEKRCHESGIVGAINSPENDEKSIDMLEIAAKRKSVTLSTTFSVGVTWVGL
ncbi:hypothetical protein Cpir12675_001593 [Ceratocystis pirilliformis]|uniref:Extracellular serine-rich protein n=1 Tax=Ceratocystis pirilliformis TaxID=259994 RepID=A0ABR3ZFT4_9PEZI